ncbi:PorT family protein [Terrimonas sp. NA20]|uniref:PorT family protein n=1 Tax=Terrimonas ginsenosidimutans TaxID=2908004 RepID=A0ABS9KNN4_9BACT|nr:outer membrane beta-barrel protein [Terrimonas ginsenosidimutans]MCG2613904.1 PorT family protein [Terrimonas ginsenosidimutans]
MKRIFTLCIALCTMATAFSQTDSTTRTTTDTSGKKNPDTIRIGGMVIIREQGGGGGDTVKSKRNRNFNVNVRLGRRNYDKPANISTNWWIVDLGFSNYNDNTDYAGAAAQSFAPGSNEDWFKLRPFKSRNVNIWVLTQRINLAKHIVNLKYGIGIELNNYFFEDKSIRFNKNPTLVDQSYSGLTKNKLAADYLTMPVMLNFNFTPNKSRAYGFSAGVSAGYLYSARQKVKLDGDVDKTKGNFDLRKWKLSYVGEVSLGVVKLYGSYAFKSMFEKGLDMTPYNFGFRFSNF